MLSRAFLAVKPGTEKIGVQELQEFRSSGACYGQCGADLRFSVRAGFVLAIERYPPS